jgi:hypothetical protein
MKCNERLILINLLLNQDAKNYKQALKLCNALLQKTPTSASAKVGIKKKEFLFIIYYLLFIIYYFGLFFEHLILNGSGSFEFYLFISFHFIGIKGFGI